tara:strand:- start:837 stop:998 length:162 start_codon:yes stop_codon:yes gene_type:complete
MEKDKKFFVRVSRNIDEKPYWILVTAKSPSLAMTSPRVSKLKVWEVKPFTLTD